MIVVKRIERPTTQRCFLSSIGCRFVFVCSIFALSNCENRTNAFAQQAPTLAHISPSPWRNGGKVAAVRKEMHSEFTSGSCLRGTFISAATTALEIPGVRVRRDSEFWFHNATPKDWDGNPWHIAWDGTLDVVSGLPVSLRKDVLARVGNTTEYRVFYTGDDLINLFKYMECS